MKTKILFIISGAILFGLLMGLFVSFIKSPIKTNKEMTTSDTSTVFIHQEASYALYTREEMIDKAAAIFLGKVINISSTRWNQDNGEYWSDGLQYYTINLEVIQPIVNPLVEDQDISVTVLGTSPLDGLSDDSLKVGDQAIFFILNTELAWRGGKHSINELIGVPSDSFFLKGSDGLYHGRSGEPAYTLPEMIEKISAQREVIKNQP